MKPYKCPVCEGKGMVPGGFYDILPNNTTLSYPAPVSCRSCGGTGVIWDPEIPIKVAPYPDIGERERTCQT